MATAAIDNPLRGLDLDEVRAEQREWSARTVRQRLAVIARIRPLFAERSGAIADAITAANPARGDAAETLSAELLPLADACAFLNKRAAKLLAPKRHGRRGRPWWLMGVSPQVIREPFGIVLAIGPSNYPLMLPGIQALQALTAGNAVLLKPGRGGTAAANALDELMRDAGLPAGLLTVLDESTQAAAAAIAAGVDHVVLTGSAETGRAVMRQAAEHLTPVTMELSGCDAVFVLPDADLDMTADAITFGMRLNRSETCIAPRRVFAHYTIYDTLLARLNDRLDLIEPRPRVIADGTLLNEDVFESVVSVVAVTDEAEALRRANECTYALGASIFGEVEAAKRLAVRIDAGVVTVNDLIVPTADPRLPFGGRHRSGFGVTRGEEGLLAMTQPKAISIRSGTFRPHYAPTAANDRELFETSLHASHGHGRMRRLAAWGRLIQQLARKGREPNQP